MDSIGDLSSSSKECVPSGHGRLDWLLVQWAVGRAATLRV